MTAVTPPLPATSDTLLVPSRLFGPLSVARSEIITMPDGMLGFAGERRWIMLPAAPEGVFWLQSIDDSGLVFLLVDPFQFFPGYVVDIPDQPEPAPGESIAVLAIVTLPKEKGAECTANLQAPVVIAYPARTARQVVLPDPAYTTRHPVDLRRKLG